MAQNQSKSDTIAHATPSLDQRTTANDVQTTAQQKNSSDKDTKTDDPSTEQPTSKGALIDAQLEVEDEGELAKKDAARAQKEEEKARKEAEHD